MQISTFRLVSGLLIVASHAALAIGGYSVLVGRVDPDKLLPTMLLLTPVFGVFAAQVVAYASANMRDRRSGPRVSILFSSLFFLVFFSHAALVTIMFRDFAITGYIASVEELQKLLGIAESAFGFLVGLLVSGAFGERDVK